MRIYQSFPKKSVYWVHDIISNKWVFPQCTWQCQRGIYLSSWLLHSARVTDARNRDGHMGTPRPDSFPVLPTDMPGIPAIPTQPNSKPIPRCMCQHSPARGRVTPHYGQTALTSVFIESKLFDDTHINTAAFRINWTSEHRTCASIGDETLLKAFQVFEKHFIHISQSQMLVWFILPNGIFLKEFHTTIPDSVIVGRYRCWYYYW